ncbi:uncharacterized protein CTRU02_215723 [Colletotrichum truncatum]|uniref:Uncharacterized protein n=1 Tax=Colletotrichum truncatum TaxID=5467 RepID=A0ACC3YC40_COLTU|nr:uncharacterized protein CTRU02_14936 [Colletotrichum truncatum]KAF6781638.1 hypothetical protein CTRU02_14936 [Colletotrichum truncatum]
MASPTVDKSWMWHPGFSEERTDTAGLFVHFRKDLNIDVNLPSSLVVHITADTRYKLYVNQQLVTFGPVKGDSNLWFYDEVDIAPYLHVGQNHIFVNVLRFFHANPYALSFPRLPQGGLRVAAADANDPLRHELCSSTQWQTAIDKSAILRIDDAEDDFLHIYEHIDKSGGIGMEWMPAKLYEFQTSTGNSAPWTLSPRLIPPMKRGTAHLGAVHVVQSDLPKTSFEAALLNAGLDTQRPSCPLTLPVGSSHVIDVEMAQHTTALVRFRFKQPRTSTGTFHVTYSECYEEEPILVPYLRRKDQRCDRSKSLFGPRDIYRFGGSRQAQELKDPVEADSEEIFAPFHFRTFRFMRLVINVGDEELTINGIDVETVNYPLDIAASFEAHNDDSRSSELWTTSLRTLINCMHDCYEDCPFYEQLQYAMDTRSSALFTYYVSGDDRLARQAIIQLHNSFQARLGLTSSRAPCTQAQVIPHFSLYWICMLNDHFMFYNDKVFMTQFLPVVDAVLGYFHGRVDAGLGLTVSESRPGIWNFVDWAESWRPYGIPPAAERTGISTYTNNLYAYTLKKAAALAKELGRPGLADEYLRRSEIILEAVRMNCFDGEFYADSLACKSAKDKDCSEQNQVWAILSGAATAQEGAELLRKCLLPNRTSQSLVRSSISMKFYTLRALSLVNDGLYEECFHDIWEPWRKQLELGLTTWEEDSVSQRSDCHAWGSAPLHEFLAEVVGIRPASPGWTAVRFRPRLQLYKQLNAKVPLRSVYGKPEEIISVSWVTDDSGKVTVTLDFENYHPTSRIVYVELPSQAVQTVYSSKKHTFRVRLDK